MTRMRNIAGTAEFLATVGVRLAGAAVVGAAMVVEVAIARSILAPLFRESTTHPA